MTPAEEQAYIDGQLALLRRQLADILRELGADSSEGAAHRRVVERTELVSMLRQVCAEHGDNDWPDDLHLADVIEKHLWRYLEQKSHRCPVCGGHHDIGNPCPGPQS